MFGRTPQSVSLNRTAFWTPCFLCFCLENYTYDIGSLNKHVLVNILYTCNMCIMDFCVDKRYTWLPYHYYIRTTFKRQQNTHNGPMDQCKCIQSNVWHISPNYIVIQFGWYWKKHMLRYKFFYAAPHSHLQDTYVMFFSHKSNIFPYIAIIYVVLLPIPYSKIINKMYCSCQWVVGVILTKNKILYNI